MKREFSAGGIIFNNKGQVLLTQNTKGYWQFPKGHIDEGQTTKEAALREVKEEGGVEVEIVEKVGVSKYVYPLDGEKIFKIVTFFLMKYISGNPEDHDREVSQARWYQPTEALKMLTFSQDKAHLKKALEMCKV